MSIFENILTKLGIKKPEQPKATTKTVARVAPNKFVGRDSVMPGRAATAPKATVKPVAIPVVDVMTKMDELAKKSPIPLNWKQSINDLMALLGMDHKPEDIKALAVELGCPASEMEDSYKRNVWTHKALLRKIAENGGNIPASLLD